MTAAVSKYAAWGDYHWKSFAQASIYRRHALFVQNWISVKGGLDVGCGDGLITSLLDGWSGIDRDPIAVELACRHGVQATVGDVYKINGLNYPAVYLGDVLEHLVLPSAALQQIAGITERLFVATPPRRVVLREHHIQEWTPLGLVLFMEIEGWKLQDRTRVLNDRIYGQFTR